MWRKAEIVISFVRDLEWFQEIARVFGAGKERERRENESGEGHRSSL